MINFVSLAGTSNGVIFESIAPVNIDVVRLVARSWSMRPATLIPNVVSVKKLRPRYVVPAPNAIESLAGREKVAALRRPSNEPKTMSSLWKKRSALLSNIEGSVHRDMEHLVYARMKTQTIGLKDSLANLLGGLPEQRI